MGIVAVIVLLQFPSPPPPPHHLKGIKGVENVMWTQAATECGRFIKAVIDLGDDFKIFTQL